MNILKKVAHAWDRFLFSEIDPLPAAGLRIVIGLLMTVSLLANAPNWHRNWAPDAMGGPWDFYQSWNVFTWTRGHVSVECFGCFAALLAVLYTVGWRPRICAPILQVILLSFHLRNWYTTNAEDTMFRMYMFYSVFLPVSDCWSIDSYIKNRSFPVADRLRTTRWCWPFRMVQIHLLLIYLISTPTKWMTDVVWRNGDAMYYVIINPMWSRWPWPWMFYPEWVSKITTYGSLLLEGSCPFLIWIPKFRKYVTCEMILFHIMLAVALANITFFSLTMIPGLLLFFTGDELRAVVQLPNRLQEQFRVRVLRRLKHA